MRNFERSPARWRQLGPWGWFTIVVLLGLLTAALWYCISAWSEVPSVGIPPIGWLFLVLGIVFTILVGGGLMTLVFYSSRKGKDF